MAEEEQNQPSLAPKDEEAPSSVEAIAGSFAPGGTESSCNDNETVKTSAVLVDADAEKSLEGAEELMERGLEASRENDFAEATDCFSRALEIRVTHYGELSPECVSAYYEYGRALLYKAQAEADPLGEGVVLKKDVKSDNDGSFKGTISGEASAASVSTATSVSSSTKEVCGGDDQEEAEEENDDEDLGEADEDESDLDLAWKMLDVARAIVEQHWNDTLKKVDILSALAEVALEREDIETSLGDYLKALSILECLVEPDSRRIAELNFRICLCLEVGSKAGEAIPYCQKAISVCKCRITRLMNEVQTSVSTTSTDWESDLTVLHSTSASFSTDAVADREGEIEILTGLCTELEKKLEDLQQAIVSPTSLLSEILGSLSGKARAGDSAASALLSSSQLGTANSGNLDSSAISTAHSNGAGGVTHLGVIGRGVKRVNLNAVDSNTRKKSAVELSTESVDNNAS